VSAVEASIITMCVCVFRLQTEVGNYRLVAEEAYRQLVQFQDRDLLTRSQDGRLRDWLDLMEEVG